MKMHLCTCQQNTAYMTVKADTWTSLWIVLSYSFSNMRRNTNLKTPNWHDTGKRPEPLLAGIFYNSKPLVISVATNLWSTDMQVMINSIAC